MNPKSPTDADQAIGARIAAVRKARGLTQTDLGIATGVTFQQIQKYETGMSRVGASRLQGIARCLGVPLSVLFEEPVESPEKSEIFDLLGIPGAVALIKALSEINDPELRRNVLDLAHSAARMSASYPARAAPLV